MPDLADLIWKSLKDFKSNLILLVPTLLAIGAALVFAIFLSLQFLFGVLVFGKEPVFSLGFLFFITILGIIDFITLILISLYFKAAKYGVTGDVVLKGKSSFKRLLSHGKTFFKPLLTFFLAQFAISLALIAALSLLALIVYILSPVAGYLLAAIFIFLYVLFLIAFSAAMVFAIPILVSKRIGGFKLIIESFKYCKSNFTHVAITVAVIILLWLLIMVASAIVGLPYYIVELAGSLAGLGFWLTIAYFASYLLSSLVSWIGEIVISLFIFNSYFDKNPVKNWK